MIVSTDTQCGAFHEQLVQTGTVTRSVDLTGITNPRLKFWAKARLFDATDVARVRVSTDGTNWTDLDTWIDGEDTNTYQAFDFDLSAYAGATNLRVQFKAEFDSTGDYLFIDDVNVTANSGLQTDTYTYDAVGNRTAKNSTSYAYDNADQLTSTGGVSYGYDNNGNQTSRGSDAFAWDHENRMTSATVSSAQTTYTYNGDGLRMSRTAGGNTTNYTWDVAGGLPMLLQDGTNTYVYGATGMLYFVDGSGNPQYRLTDGLGSTAAMANSGGTVTDTWTYDVFGAVRSHSGSSGTQWLFAGEQNDPNGLEYLRARYYDPATGRFMSRDPLGGGYPYAGGNPANMVDPTGLYALLDIDDVCGAQSSGPASDPVPDTLGLVAAVRTLAPPPTPITPVTVSVADSTPIGVTVPPTLLVAAAVSAGFSTTTVVTASGETEVVTIVAIALAESNGRNIANPEAPSVQGVLQINTAVHVCDAFNVRSGICMRIQFSGLNDATNFSPWDAFTVGTYVSCVPIAIAATQGINMSQSGCPMTP